MVKKIGILFNVFLLFFMLNFSHAQKGVSIREETLTIPTYLTGAPEKNPMFYTGRAYQGAQGRIYPYPIMDKLTDIRKDKTYNAVYLENCFIKVCVLPEIGGRIFEAVDKTNNYDFLYRQHVIKPALIGMLGAWISGGVEWNVPHHHRASAFMPVDYVLIDNNDGSKTIWVGETELRHRMKWIVGLTLYPDKSYIEITGRLFNRTPIAHSFLFWANNAVHGNPDYQVIFPPGTEYATYHSKNDFTQWPISHQIYSGADYTAGVDVSWWKNHPKPTSMFAWNYEDDFLAGYDHGQEAGTIFVANHHIVPGKKLWEWGPGPRGQMWDKILTETDGPYVELMIGAYSDNQPDYSWCQPYVMKEFTQYWYPFRKIKSVKNANRDAAINLEISNHNKVRFGFNTTARYEGAQAVLKSGSNVFYQETFTIGPGNPYWKEITIPEKVNKDDITAILFTAEGEEIIRYQPVKKAGKPMPEPVSPPPPPEEIETVEELYLAGLRLEQFYNPALEPYPYYEEALKRDPGDYRVNTRLGIDRYKKGLYEEAEEYLARAVKRITKNYTRPKDGEAHYYLGLTHKALRKYHDARDEFYKATWTYAWYSAGHYQLAEIACIEEELDKALNHIERSLFTNSANTGALNMKAVLLTEKGDYNQSEEIISKVLSLDPINFWALNERYRLLTLRNLTGEAQKNREKLISLMRDNAQNYLELATCYGNLGFFDEAIDVLTRLTERKHAEEHRYPLLYYYIGYYYGRKGDTPLSLKYYREAAMMPCDYCFPFRKESREILTAAIKNNPDDAKAHYYLGNLLYEKQPEEAIMEWEKSRDIDDAFSIVYRNLAFGYGRIKNDLPEAISSLEKAIECKPDDPRLYYELDVLYEMAGTSPEKRLSLLENNHETVKKRDDVLSREIILCVQLGNYDKAIELLTTHHFHVWEGGGQIHNVYVDAHVLRGKKYFKENNYRKALKDFEAALEYPENLEVGRPASGGPASKIFYFIGMTFEALGEEKKAREFYTKSIEHEHGWSEIKYYQGLSMLKLGLKEKADIIFDGLIQHGKSMLKRITGMDFFAKFGERQSMQTREALAHYLTGLGYLGKGMTSEARRKFETALELNINHLGAKTHLAEIENN